MNRSGKQRRRTETTRKVCVWRDGGGGWMDSETAELGKSYKKVQAAGMRTQGFASF